MYKLDLSLVLRKDSWKKIIQSATRRFSSSVCRPNTSHTKVDQILLVRFALQNVRRHRNSVYFGIWHAAVYFIIIISTQDCDTIALRFRLNLHWCLCWNRGLFSCVVLWSVFTQRGKGAFCVLLTLSEPWIGKICQICTDEKVQACLATKRKLRHSLTP